MNPMSNSDRGSTNDDAAPKRDGRYVLRLYVTGMTERSRHAIEAIKRICAERLAGQYDLQIVDITQHPQLAVDEQIIAAPTLIKHLPVPLRRLVGDLSNEERVLLGLDLRPGKGSKADSPEKP
jgi:circadian clock protein KaiB